MDTNPSASATCTLSASSSRISLSYLLLFRLFSFSSFLLALPCSFSKLAGLSQFLPPLPLGLHLCSSLLHFALQSFFGARSSDNLHCFPFSYQSPQSLLVLRQRDWKSTSEIWLRQCQENFSGWKKVHFAYDTIEAPVSVKASRSAESEKERTALAKCFAEFLPIHLDLFTTGDPAGLIHFPLSPPSEVPIHWNLFTTGDPADLIPFLYSSKYVPSVLFSHENSVIRGDLDAVALVKIATCND